MKLKAVPAGCPEPDAPTGHARTSGQTLTQPQDDQLPQSIKTVRADDLPTLHTPADSPEQDPAAVTAGPTLPSSSGVAEGHVNRTKTIKRQMHGRAGLELPRKQVLPA